MFLQQSDTGHVDHTLGQILCSGVVNWHKMDSMVFFIVFACLLLCLEPLRGRSALYMCVSPIFQEQERT